MRVDVSVAKVDHHTRIRREAISVLRTASESVPELGDPKTWLASLPECRDAAITLFCLNISGATTVDAVNHPVFTEEIYLRLLARHVTLSLTTVLKRVAHA